MTTVALNAALAAPTPTPDPARELNAPLTGVLSFHSVLTTVARQDKPPGAKGADTRNSFGAMDSLKRNGQSKDDEANPREPLSIEAGLAAMGYGAAAGAPIVPMAAATSTARDPHARPDPKAVTATVKLASAAQGATAEVGASISGLSTADAQESEPFDGVATLNALIQDPTLGIQDVKSRTYMGVATLPQAPAAVPAAAVPSAPPVRSMAAARASAGAAPGANSGTNGRTAGAFASNGGAGASGDVPQAHGLTASPVDPAALTSDSVDPTLAALSPAADSSANAAVVLAPGQLADFVAEQAEAMAPAAAGSPTTAGAASKPAQAVKELEISLDPSDLGALSLKMRMENGKLSVTISVSKSTTLSAIEGERQTIVDRLGSNGQPLEDLTIKPDDKARDHSEGHHGSDSNETPHSRSRGDDPAGRGAVFSPGGQFGSRGDLDAFRI